MRPRLMAEVLRSLCSSLKRGRSSILLLVCTVVLVAACSASDSGFDKGTEAANTPATPPAAGANGSNGSPQPSAPFDLGAVMRQVHFAFRPDNDGWVGGHGAYSVRASSSSFTVTPSRVVQADAASSSTSPHVGSKASSQVVTGAPATFETRSIGRVGQPGAVVAGPGRVEADGHFAASRGEAVEHLRNSEEGVEQSFSFERRPAGNGELEIRVHVSGQVYAGESESGHHFVDPATGTGLRYGQAKWVDGSGRQSMLPVRYEQGDLILTAPAALIDGSTYPALLDPVISAEFGMDNPIQVPAYDSQTAPKVAFDGTNYLVAWVDRRVLGNTNTDFCATRVNSAGDVLDPGGILIASLIAATVANLDVAFNGTNYMFVWNAGSHIRAARVTPAGTLLDPSTGILIHADLNPVYDPHIVSDGTDYFVAFGANNSMYARRVTAAGTPLPLITVGGFGSPLDVAFDGTNYLIVFPGYKNSYYDIRGTRVTPQGMVLDPSGFDISTAANDQLTPAVACDGTHCLVVWSDNKWGNLDIYGSLIDPNGTVLNPTGIAISMVPNLQSTPSIVYDGTNYVVVWSDTRSGNPDIYGARVNTSGMVLDTAGIPLFVGAQNQQVPAVACGGGMCLAAWEDKRLDAGDIFGTRFDAAGTVLQPTGFAVATAANHQNNPAVASNGTDYLVVWEDLRVGGTITDLYGTRVAASGAILDPSGIAISTAPGNQLDPAVASDGTNYLVVWEEVPMSLAPNIGGKRVGANGVVLDAMPLAISAAPGIQDNPAVAYGSGNYYVVWEDLRNGTGTPGAYGTRVTPDGIVQDPLGEVVVVDSQNVHDPVIAYDGTTYLIVWRNATAATIRARRMLWPNTMLDSALGFKIADAIGVAPPAVAFDGLNFLVVHGTSNVYAFRVSSGALVLDPNGLPLSTAANDQGYPAVAFDGTDCLVVWTDTRSSPFAALYGTWITEAGDVLDPGGLLISSYPNSTHGRPAMAGGSPGRMLLAYARQEVLPFYGSHRVHARRITTPLPLGEPCGDAAECLSGFCVDDVCCDSACSGSATGCAVCSVALGAAADGTCTPLSGATCNDGNACTQSDLCQVGTCVGSNPVTCSALDQCYDIGTCDPMTGQCSNPVKPDGAACDDGLACTTNDSCQMGNCTSNPVVCPPSDACKTVSACDPATGMCPTVLQPNGTPCNDGTACTQNDTCQAGTCVGSNPVVCPAPDQCHDAGTCNPATGQCSNPAKPNNTACSDGNGCTLTDTCQGGICVSGSPAVCPADQCQNAGTCDQATGQCSNPTPKADGTTCDDSDACTQSDACQAGTCAGTPTVCAALDECHYAGTCDSFTGNCTNPTKPDGTACTGGTCDNGACVPSGSGGASTSSNGSGASGTGGGSSTTSGAGAGNQTGAGGDSGNTPTEEGGCACRIGQSSPSNLPILGLALAWLAARRRRSRREQCFASGRRWPPHQAVARVIQPF